MSLRWRIALSLATIATLVAAGAVFASRSVARRAQTSEIQRFLDDRADEISQQVPLITRRRRNSVALCMAASENGFRRRGGPGLTPWSQGLDMLQIVDTQGAAVCEIDGPLLDPATAAALITSDPEADRSARFRRLTVDGDRFLVRQLRPEQGETLILLGRRIDEAEAVVDQVTRQMLVLGAGAVVLAAVLGHLTASRIVEPVSRLRRAAEAVATTEDLETPVPVTGGGEVAGLAESFNTMLNALKTSKQQQQRLVTDASHELRTPITSLRTNVELLRRDPTLTPADREAMLGDVSFELVQLTDLVEELVELSTDHKALDQPVEPIDLAAAVEAVAERFRRRSGRAIALVSENPVPVMARSAMIERAVANLVDNALKYSPVDRPVEILVSGGSVEVVDHGRGIDPGDSAHVFERFYRADAARTQPGSGLGLSIVAANVEIHGGRYWSRATPGGGATVGFELPTDAGG